MSFFYHLFQHCFIICATFWSGSMCLYKYRYWHDFECILGENSVSKFFKEFTSADLSQIAREKWCDHLLIIYMHVFLLPLRKEIDLLKKIPLYCCVLFIWLLAEQSLATVVSSMAVFVRTFMHTITAEWRRNLKAFLTWVTY